MLDPAPDRGMVDGQASFRHQLLKVTQAQAESAVPSDARNDDVRLELSLPEQRWPAGPHGVNLPNSQMQHFPKISPEDCDDLSGSNRAIDKTGRVRHRYHLELGCSGGRERSARLGLRAAIARRGRTALEISAVVVGVRAASRLPDGGSSVSEVRSRTSLSGVGGTIPDKVDDL